MSRTVFAVTIFSLLLAGCRTIVAGCPPLVTYSDAQQDQALAELGLLPKDSQLGKMIVDYGKTRDACRARDGP